MSCIHVFARPLVGGPLLTPPQVVNLSRRMLFDQVDAVRRSTAEQLIMAARIDLDRCPTRLLHHVPGACSRETSLLPSLSPPTPCSLSPRSPPVVAEGVGGPGGAGLAYPPEEGEVAGCGGLSGVVGDRLEVDVPAGGWGGVEVEDRAGACGLWLRLAIMPLVRECLEGSYRSKLLALHMTQVRRCGAVRGGGDSLCNACSVFYR